jgi:Deacetylases, including yeast histone deacetylase and acetoin utilization protein
MKVVFSELYKTHNPPFFHHVENSDRLEKALSSLHDVEIVEPSSPANPEEIHDRDYVELVRRFSAREEPLDQDTYTNKYTYEVARLALGGAMTAYQVQGIALVRPPGHHAGKYGRAMGAPTQGFCIFNNIAYVANKIREKIAIVDFDVHHGNGTQELFYSDPRVLHIDIHQDPTTLYPGTGFPFQVGEREGAGYKLNFVLPPGAGDDTIEELIPVVQSILDQFNPDVLAFSAGFDAFEGDGLASIRLSEFSFELLGSLGKGRKWFATLEGGYNVGIERGLPAFIRGLELNLTYPKPNVSDDSVMSRFMDELKQTKLYLNQFWRL